jgi:hypothetical protein
MHVHVPMFPCRIKRPEAVCKASKESTIQTTQLREESILMCRCSLYVVQIEHTYNAVHFCQ